VGAPTLPAASTARARNAYCPLCRPCQGRWIRELVK